MIVCASRRTDIPALYSSWLLNRLEAGYAMTPHPRKPKNLWSVSLSPEHVDCLVFWTKNPAPMLDKLHSIESMGHSFYFQFTLTPYDETIEINIPAKIRRIEIFGNLCRLTGPERIIWRYDPVIIDSYHTCTWHFEQFEYLCSALHKYTKKCIVSFIDSYRNIKKIFRKASEAEQWMILSGFSRISSKHGLVLHTCSENINAENLNISHASCVDKNIIENITGYAITAKRDRNQRPACRCVESVDIGAYGTCIHGCRYCYATFHEDAALRRWNRHDANAPMITGYPIGDEVVTDRTKPTLKDLRLRLF